MSRSSRPGAIFGGLLLLGIDAYGIAAGKLPLKGAKAVEFADFPTLFWAYSIGLGVLGVAAIFWGVLRRG